ncbi:MAG: leucine-rich repeat domain-containing protein, partial [Promethearchaeota archaeon]
MTTKYIPSTNYSNRNLTSFDEIVEDPSSIGKLDCSHNNFESFAGFPPKMNNLVYLYMDNNRLHSFDGFPSAPLIRALTISSNKFNSLASLANLTPSLQALDANNNHISSLDDLSSLSNLTHISINSNKLTSLEGLPPVFLLTTLHASGNHLENFLGFPALPSEMIPTDPRALGPKLELEFYDNPLRSFHGLPRYFLPAALKTFRFSEYLKQYTQYPPPTRDEFKKRLSSFQFSARGAELIRQCLILGNGCAGSILDCDESEFDEIGAWLFQRSRGPDQVYNLRTHRWEDVTEAMLNDTDDPENPMTDLMRWKYRAYSEYLEQVAADPNYEHECPWGEQERYNAPFPPAWYEAYDTLYDYYRRSPT